MDDENGVTREEEGGEGGEIRDYLSFGNDAMGVRFGLLEKIRNQ